MVQDSFEHECDRLSHIVDKAQFERLRWAKTEGPMLARLVELSQSAIDAREDFELSEEGSTSETRRYVLKVHGKRIIAIVINLNGNCAVIRAECIERSSYKLSDAAPIFEDFCSVDQQWMSNALQELFRRVELSADVKEGPRTLHVGGVLGQS